MIRCTVCYLLAVAKSTCGKTNVLRLHSIHKRNKFGETHVHLAVMKGDLQAVKNMIEVGASVNLADNAGTVQLGRTQSIKWLRLTHH